MKCKILSAALLLLAFGAAHAQIAEKKNELGLALGWGGPSGNGIEYSYYLNPSHSLGAGAGFSLSGAKLATGYRYYFMPEKWVTPYAGLSASWASGLSSVNVTVNSDSAKYDIKSGVTVAPRAGLRIQTPLINWYINTGYHIVLSGGGSEYKSGSTRQVLRDFADIVALGGFEVSAGLMFRL